MISLKKSQIKQEKSNKEEGSITIFLALTLILILSFLFSMLELARVKGMQQLAKRKLTLELESVFGGYNQELWEYYGLLFWDMSNGSDEPDVRHLESRIMEDVYQEGEENHFYQKALKDVKVESYVLATDRNGAEFKRQACRTAKEQLTEKGVETLKSRVEIWQGMEEESGDLEQKWEEALEAKEEAEHSEEVENSEEEIETLEGTEGDATQKNPLPENPIAYVAKLKTSPVLAMVLEDSSQLSGKGIDIADSLDNRALFCGNMTIDSESSVDKLWLVQYLNEYFSSKTNSKGQGHALDYELEYCIGGKATDAENLEAVVKKLILLRESANFVTIMKDSQKKAMALELATAVVGFTGIVPLIKAVQMGILVAWCYVESILDVRCLLEGGKVPLVKNNSQWKSDPFHLSEGISQNNAQKEESGMGYGEYLQMLLYMTGEEQLISRAMNVIEKNVRLFSGNGDIRMDAMVSGVKVTASYSANPLFLSVIPIGQKMDGSYYFTETQKFMYKE